MCAWREAWIYTTTLFSILTGSTGVSHKTTVVRRAVETLKRVDPAFVVQTGSGSREGLMKALPPGGGNVLYRTSEFTQHLRKAANSGTANLVEFLLELYDHPAQLEHYLAGERVAVKSPCVAILSDSTEAYLSEVFTTAAIGNGLLNRLSIWMGEPAPPSRFRHLPIHSLLRPSSRRSGPGEMKWADVRCRLTRRRWRRGSRCITRRFTP